jgi:hypothetical protein
VPRPTTGAHSDGKVFPRDQVYLAREWFSPFPSEHVLAFEFRSATRVINPVRTHSARTLAQMRSQ